MGSQLKQALINAGIVQKETLKDVEKEKVRKLHLKDGKKMKEEQIRIICEVCGKGAPDVEHYDHKNKKIEGRQWLCIPCADEHCIDDACRMTEQSSYSKTGMFCRRYGRTKSVKKLPARHISDKTS